MNQPRWPPSGVGAGAITGAPPADAQSSASRLYAASLRVADWLGAHRVLVAALGAPLVIAALAALGQWILLGFPNSGDEYVYLLQAQTLNAGRLWWPAPPSPDLFAMNYVATEGGRTFGTFPPGWPLALALAMSAGVPVWLVNPIIGAATLALVWTLGAQLYGARAGVLAAVLLGVSPFFAFNAASYFSHPFCGALLLAAACVASRADRRPWWVPVLVGALIGWAVLTRYLTGVLCGAAIVWWLVRPGAARSRTLALTGLGGLPWIAGLFAYDLALSGSGWQLTTTQLTVSRWFADGFLLRGADILASHLVRHLLWTPPVLIVAYLVYLRTAPRESRRGLFTWLPVVMAAALYFYMERGGNQYGARFHYEVFPFLVIFVAAQVFRAADYALLPSRDQRMFRLLGASVGLMPAAFVVHAIVEHGVIRERMHPFASASAAGLNGALVLIAGRVGTRRSMAAADLTRNGPLLDDPVLFGVDLGPGRRCVEASRLPDRTAYVYRWDSAARTGRLTPLTCP
jgi:hypothetical protein